jgi:hypothetical protein
VVGQRQCALGRLGGEPVALDDTGIVDAGVLSGLAWPKRGERGKRDILGGGEPGMVNVTPGDGLCQTTAQPVEGVAYPGDNGEQATAAVRASTIMRRAAILGTSMLSASNDTAVVWAGHCGGSVASEAVWGSTSNCGMSEAAVGAT